MRQLTPTVIKAEIFPNENIIQRDMYRGQSFQLEYSEGDPVEPGHDGAGR